MRSNLALLFAALALPLALACGSSSAPTASGPLIEDISDAEILAVSSASDLSEEQRAALRAAFEEARARLAAVRARYAAGEITAAEATAIARQIHAELLAAIEAILTPEQLDRFQHRPPVPLGLTPEQRAQIATLHRELMAFAHELREQLMSGAITAEEARALLRAKAHEIHLEVCGILTPEQQSRIRFCPGG